MNRLILIGNGFDLAHNLKTSYKDFIEYLWKGIFEEIKEEALENGVKATFDFYDKNKLVSNISCKLISINDKNSFVIEVNNTETGSNTTFDNNLFDIEKKEAKGKKEAEEILKYLIQVINSFETVVIEETIKFSHIDFFQTITQNYLNKNWSDIEADYYKELIKVKNNQADINELNKQFNRIKELLKEYLQSLAKPNKIDKLESIIYEPIKVEDISLLNLNNFKQEVQGRVRMFFSEKKSNRVNTLRYLRSKKFKIEKLTNPKGNLFSLKNIINSIDINNKFAAKHLTSFLFKKKDQIDSEITDLFLANNVLLLNFNYTETEEQYIKNLPRNYVLDEDVNIQVNHIHGSLDDASNHMIFGYGDEESEEYKKLENPDYKGLLDNVKSINYLEASNYRDMERFIEADKFQIFIMGMSCGMADHTMLHKLFQHENCVSVKPFYYQWKDDKSNICDNYTEIVQNISRCFSDKDLLRSIVVDKTNCEPLPQWDD